MDVEVNAKQDQGASSPAREFLASVVVFLVALPLCMGIALASGVPVAAGLITGIVGGIMVGLIGGAPLQVSGPAAGLAVVVYEIVRKSDHGLEVLAITILIAGGVQLAAGLLRFGQWFRAVSPAVIHGMLAGIGILILVSQFHMMVDDDPRATPIQNILSIPESIYRGLMPVDGSSHHWAARIGLLTILVIVAWKWLAPRKMRVVPAPLVAVLLATAVTGIVGLDIKHVEMPEGGILGAVTLPSLSSFRLLLDGQVLLAGLAMAFIASAETLLCATAVDKMQSGPRTNYDRELTAQGIGNMTCGLLGGLPMTGVIVRSAANVEAGARTRWSAVMHGTWLLLLVMLLPNVLGMIPKAALAAILVYTGYKLVSPQAIRNLRQYGWSEVAIYAATIVMIIAADLLTGVLVGVVLSVGKLLYTFSHLDVASEERREDGSIVLHLRGAATFVRLPQLAATLEKVPRDCELHVHFEELTYIDHACLELLMGWEKQCEAVGGRLVLDWNELTARFHEANGKTRPQVKSGPVGPRRQTLLSRVTRTTVTVSASAEDAAAG